MRILYLDSSTDHTRPAHPLVSKLGDAYQWQCVTTADALLTALSTQALDLVLIVCHTGQWDGIDVLRRVKRQQAATPVILLDASATVAAAVTAMQQGAANYLPDTPECVPDLASAIRCAVPLCLEPPAAAVGTNGLLSRTQDLERSNRSLHMLYKITGALAAAPLSRPLLENALTEVRQVVEFASAKISGLGENSVLADLVCDIALAPQMLTIPLRDQAQLLGTLQITLTPGQNLAPWEQQLLETVAYHFSTALLAAHRQEETRRIAALEERASIARELHDSLAQSLWFARIQMARLAKANEAATSLMPEQRERLNAVVAELQSGLDDAHRQLRQLISGFRAQDGAPARATKNVQQESAAGGK